MLREAELLSAKGDYASAAEKFGSALEKLVQLYGDLSPETASCYYQYGHALLQSYVSTLDTRLFGAEILQAASDALAPPQSSQDSDPGSTVNEVGSSIGDNGEEELQFAWESLESARIIYSRTFNYPALLDVHAALGELESSRENYGSAAEEYKRALECSDPQTAPRQVAELEYRLGLAYLAIFGNEADSIEHLERAVEILERVVVQQPLDEDLASILKDVKEKLEDAKEQQNSLPAVKTESQSLSQSIFDLPSCASGPVTDLGIFGKRKSKAAEKPELSQKQTKSELSSQ